VELVRKGELDAAAAEFEEAYRLSPNYSVLYNLGQAYSMLGRPIQSVNALEKYLELGGDRVDATRRRQVLETIARNNDRIGSCELSIAPQNATVTLDGRAVSADEFGRPMRLSVGMHTLTATSDGHVTHTQSVEITAKQTTKISVRLEPVHVELPAPRVGQLALACIVPSVQVRMDGRAVAISSDPVLVPIGNHELRWSREGYTTAIERVEVSDQTVTHAACALHPEPGLPPLSRATWVLRVSQNGALITIDGQHAANTVVVPHGPHRVSVRRTGFEDWVATLDAKPGETRTVEIELRATPAHQRELDDAARSKRTWAYVIGGIGASLLGTGVAVGVENGHRYTQWASDRDAFNRDVSQGFTPGVGQRAAELETRATSIQARDDVAIGLGALGGGLLGYAVISGLGAQ